MEIRDFFTTDYYSVYGFLDQKHLVLVTLEHKMPTLTMRSINLGVAGFTCCMVEMFIAVRASW